jgi:hypothetical protein
MRYPKEYYPAFYRDFFDIFPRFIPLQDKIKLIYAGTNTHHCFNDRNLSDIVEEVAEALEEGKEYFIFDNSSETFMTDFYRIVVKVSKYFPLIPPQNFYYTSGAFPDIDIFYKEFNSPPEINLLFSVNQVLRGVRRVEHIKDILPSYEIRLKEKLFLCYNKIERPHRIYTFAYLSKNNLLDKGYFSFQGVNNRWIPAVLVSKHYAEWIKHEVRRHIRDFPYVLNIGPDRENPIDIQEDDFKHFTESYFSIINETTCFSHSLNFNAMMRKYINMPFLTDKTVKAFIMRHPFIVNASPYFLRRLRSIGYRTFHPYIDESYDIIENDEDRISAVFKEISRLCDKTDSEWLEWQQSVADILEHNFKRTFEMNDFELKKELYGF